MSKSSATTKFTGRTAIQGQVAQAYMPQLVTATTASTITFSAGPAEVDGAIYDAINEAKAKGAKGDSQALHSLKRLSGAYGMRNSSNATAAVKAQAAKVVVTPAGAGPVVEAHAKAVKATKAPATKAPATKAPRAKLPHADVAVDGYTVRWPHASFDLLKRTDKAPADSPAWLVRCNAHGTTTPAANATQGDAKGSKAGRPDWCKPCAKEAGVPATKAPATKATKAPAKGAKAGRKLAAVK